MTELIPEKSEEEEQAFVFGNQSLNLKCPYCLNRVKSQIIERPELASLLCSFIFLVILPGIFGLIATLLILSFTSIKKHRCKLCFRELGTDGKFLYFLRDQVYSWNLGKTGVVFTKKSLVTSLLVVLTIIIFYNRSYFERPITYKYNATTWQQFHEKCSRKLLKDKSIRKQCQSNFLGKTFVNWSGYIMRIEDNRNTFTKFYKHAIKIYVKMYPQQKKSKPQVILNFNTLEANQLEAIVDQLHHGDQIMFNATIRNLKPSQMRYLHIVNIKKTGKTNKDIKYYLYQEQLEQILMLRTQDQIESSEEKNQQIEERMFEQKKGSSPLLQYYQVLAGEKNLSQNNQEQRQRH